MNVPGLSWALNDLSNRAVVGPLCYYTLDLEERPKEIARKLREYATNLKGETNGID